MISYQIGMVVKLLVDFYMILIVVYCLFSWIPNKGPTLQTVDVAVSNLVEPYLNLFRKIIPPVGGIDFSPVIAILVIQLVARLIFQII